MSNDVQGDAILIQPKHLNGGYPDYQVATGIIRRMNSPTGAKWLFNNLMPFGDSPLLCSGSKGNMEEVINSAKYQYGDKLFDNELLSVSYRDASFPSHLLPS